MGFSELRKKSINGVQLRENQIIGNSENKFNFLKFFQL